MKRICFLLIFIGMASVNTWGQKKKEINSPVQVSYMLPQVSLEVQVVLACTQFIPGPFSSYAEKQLGKQADITTARQEWQIQHIRIIPRHEPDPQRLYTITADGLYSSICLHLTPEGLLAGVGRANTGTTENREMVYSAPKQPTVSPINYVDFGILPTLKEVLDSNFTQIEVEGEIRQAWDPIVRHELKQESDYVKEVTEEIFNIRQKRLNMLAGEHASGQATRAALDELRKLEEQYMSLFMGKKVTRIVEKTFTYIPRKANEQISLFRFSPSSGIVPKNDVSAIPYVLEIRNVVIPGTSNTPTSEEALPQGGITYRVPALAEVRLCAGNQHLLSQKFIIPQLGYLQVFPIEVINHEGITIDFYPEYGSIKSINKKP